MEVTTRKCVSSQIRETKKYKKGLLAFLVISIWMFLISLPVYAASPILVIRIDGKDFKQAVRGLTQETEEEFSIVEMIVNRHTTVREIDRKIRIVSPKLVILMDNISISLYKKYQAASGSNIPSVSLMASFTDIAIRGMKNAAGIFYEVPLVTSMVNLRTIMPNLRFRRIGVLYRDFMAESIRANQKYCKKERIELIAYPIHSKGDIDAELKKGLNLLNIKGKIDALWILNDSKLINAKLLRNVWLPFAQKFKKPIIVGVEVLVQPAFRFGTFGVIPDHTELGVQAAEMVYDIMENNWKVEQKRVEQPRSVYKILNLVQAQELFQVRKEELTFVDKVLR